jgi:type IV secretory pathway TrbD component
MRQPTNKSHTAEMHVIHSSLWRPALLMGVEPAVAVLEGTTALALIFVVGLHVVTLGLAVFYLTVVHSVMAWVAKQDALMSQLYIRSLAARDYYAPHASVRAGPSSAHAAVPESGR